MKEVSKQNFGLVIAYLLPGLVVLWGVSFFSDTVRMWLTTGEEVSPTVAGFLYVTLAAFTAGLTLGAIRTVTIDALHHYTGVTKPEWDFSEFQAKFWAFNQLVESHYCLYQFYAHMSLALPASVAARSVALGEWQDWSSIVGCLLLEAVFLGVSRGTLKTHYARVTDLLGTEEAALSLDRRKAMTRSHNRRGKTPSAAAAHTPAAEKAPEQLSDRREPRKVARW